MTPIDSLPWFCSTLLCDTFVLSATQVMKMIMTLNVQESGRVKYIKRPGVILEAGCVVARLELDDPSKVHAVCGSGS